MENFRITQPGTSDDGDDLFLAYENGEYLWSSNFNWESYYWSVDLWDEEKNAPRSVPQGIEYEYYIPEIRKNITASIMESPWHWYHFALQNALVIYCDSPGIYVEGKEPALPQSIKKLITDQAKNN